MASNEEIDRYHEQMILSFLKSLNENGRVSAMMLMALRTTSFGVTVEVHCGGSTHDIYRASATLLESVLKPGELGTSRILPDEERVRVRKLCDAVMDLAGYDRDDIRDLEFEQETIKRK